MHGWGKSSWHRGQKLVFPSGFTYLGPCRCGRGPHAYYQDPAGRIIQAWHTPVWGWLPPERKSREELKTEIDLLKRERDDLEKHLQDLEVEYKKKAK